MSLLIIYSNHSSVLAQAAINFFKMTWPEFASDNQNHVPYRQNISKVSTLKTDFGSINEKNGLNLP